VSERLEELQDLSKKAESGDKEARRELRRAVKRSAPEVIARASDIAGIGQRVLARTRLQTIRSPKRPSMPSSIYEGGDRR
jgi:hypothetical protein